MVRQLRYWVMATIGLTMLFLALQMYLIPNPIDRQRNGVYLPKQISLKNSLIDSPGKRSLTLKKQVEAGCKIKNDSNVLTTLDYDRYVERHKFHFTFHYAHSDWWMLFHYDEKLNVIFPVIPKCGSTNIRYFMYAMVNEKSRAYNYSLSELNKVFRLIDFGNISLAYFGRLAHAEKAKSAMKNYFKFVFFREPLERLYSAYHHIFLDKAFNKRIWSPEKIQGLSDQVKNIYGEVDNPFSFRDFLRYILSQPSLLTADIHWRPQVYMAHPCAIKYDFIGYTSTMTEDMQWIAWNGFNVRMEMPREQESSPLEKILTIADHDLIKQVLEKHYKIDYNILGFRMPV